MVQAVVVYDSAFGNSEIVAKIVAHTLASFAEVRLLHANDARLQDLESADLLVVGSPTQGGQPTKTLQVFLDTIPDKSLKGKNVAAFDTRLKTSDQHAPLKVLMKVIDFAAPKIAKRLEARGGNLVEDPVGFLVGDKEGPLKEGEPERAREWAKRVAAASGF